MSINAASMALAMSNIPWDGPVGAVRLGFIDNEPVVSPTRKQMQKSCLDMILAGTAQKNVLMIEMGANDIPLHCIQQAISQGIKAVQTIANSISELQKKCAKTKRNFDRINVPSEIFVESAKQICESDLKRIFTDASHDKISRDVAVKEVRKFAIEKLKEKFPGTQSALLESALNSTIREIFRCLVFENNRRCDGRQLEDLRKIDCKVDLYQPLHGSALFQRGQSQVLSTVTFDSLEFAAKVDPISQLLSGMKEKNFMLHYEFPPYAVNEIATGGRWVGRRELGHGALAERSLRPVIPKEYPFTIRLTSEVLESNGSTSMASVCGGTLALLDASVPISASVAGVAIGLLTKYSKDDPSKIDDYRILTDILGIEDYMGDMDFKIAGTAKGFTAMQMDLKIPGIPLKILMDAFEASVKAKNRILSIMAECMDEPRTTMKENGPVSEKMTIPVQKRAKFMGVGGYNLKRVENETGISITQIDETNYTLFAPNKSAMDEAKEMINEFLKDDFERKLEFGAIYKAKILEIRDKGVMIALYPDMPPVLLPTLQLDQRRVAHPSALGLEVGQEITVKYFGRDPATGAMRLSRRSLQTTAPVGVRHMFQGEDAQKSPWISKAQS